MKHSLVLLGSDQQCLGHVMQRRFPGVKLLCQHRFAKKSWWQSSVGICTFGQLLSVFLQDVMPDFQASKLLESAL